MDLWSDITESSSLSPSLMGQWMKEEACIVVCDFSPHNSTDTCCVFIWPSLQLGRTALMTISTVCKIAAMLKDSVHSVFKPAYFMCVMYISKRPFDFREAQDFRKVLWALKFNICLVFLPPLSWRKLHTVQGELPQKKNLWFSLSDPLTTGEFSDWRSRGTAFKHQIHTS